MHQAIKIEIYCESVGPLSFAALRRHAKTLQHLSIPRAMDSWMTRDVLCAFTRLEYLKTPRIDAKDIVEGDPWACTNLRKMSVMIAFSSEEDYLQPVVYERMSRLVHVDEFDNHISQTSGAKLEHGLIFRLQSGMGALARLTRLRSLWLDSGIQAMDSDDVRWIMDHWKRLQNIRGQLNQDISMRKQLEGLFSRSGIEIWDP